MTSFNWRKWISPCRGGSFIAATLIAAVLMLPASAFAGTRAKYLAFYGTNVSDWSIVEVPTSGPLVWKILKNPSSPVPGAAQISIFNWGQAATDSISPGSYNGDNFFDVNVSRPGAPGTPIINWTYYFPSSPGGVQTPWGVSSGAPPDNVSRNGDYDGDGIEDFATFRITGGQLTWFIRPSSSPGTMRTVNYGVNLAAPTSLFVFEGADFTGDGRDELVMARVNTNTGLTIWFVGDAITGTQLFQVVFGNWITDYLIQPADYTGDGKADFPVYRVGVANPNNVQFWIMNSATGQTTVSRSFGIGDPNFTNNDIPVRGDYDGDLIDDIAVWRPSTAVFWVLRSSDGALVAQQWGVGGASPDIPVGFFFCF